MNKIKINPIFCIASKELRDDPKILFITLSLVTKKYTKKY